MATGDALRTNVRYGRNKATLVPQQPLCSTTPGPTSNVSSLFKPKDIVENIFDLVFIIFLVL